ncbi:MAG: cation-translocating P-type ATPase [bacterium]
MTQAAAPLLQGPPSVPSEDRDLRNPDPERACALCGFPVGKAGIRRRTGGTELRFCCSGCAHVFEILSNVPGGPPADFRDTDLYRTCVASGLISRSPSTGETGRAPDPAGEGEAARPPAADAEADLSREIVLSVEGMWCTACSWLVEELLRGTPGILEAKVHFFSDLARIRYLPHRLDLPDLFRKASRFGYRVSVFQDRPGPQAERTSELVRLGVSCILTANIMMISFALYAGFFRDLGPEAIRALSWPLFAMATPVVFYCGAPILRKGLSGIRAGAFPMETLIAAGALSAYVSSVAGLATGSLHLYFDTASMLVTLVLLGRHVESRARRKVAGQMTGIYRLAHMKVRLATDGKAQWVSADEVEPGDRILVLEGERVPVDGRILAGRATVDASVLTGESRPVTKSVRDEILAGCLLLTGRLEVCATAAGTQSSIQRMIRVVEQALSRKNPVERMADRITRRFVPAILALAAGTAAWLIATGRSPEAAMLRAVTILAVTCPCALGIAAPLVKVATMAVGRSMGILVRDPGAFEKAAGLNVLVFDKTGTVTSGRFSLQEIFTPGHDPRQALLKAASLELGSDHFLAREIVRRAREAAGPGPDPEEAQCVEVLDGLGVRGVVDGSLLWAGSRRLMESLGFGLAEEVEERARTLESGESTIVFLAWEGRVRGFLAFGDTVRVEAAGVVARLASRKIETWLVSGDSARTTDAVGERLGFRQSAGKASPLDKAAIVRTLQEQGSRVGMVGDGINDAPALAQADVSFAFGTKTGVIHEAADVTLLAEDPARLLDFLELAAAARKIVGQNLFFAFLYNVLGIPLAVAGLINPLVAVVAMFASSLTVVGNTLRLMKIPRRSRLYPLSPVPGGEGQGEGEEGADSPLIPTFSPRHGEKGEKPGQPIQTSVSCVSDETYSIR